MRSTRAVTLTALVAGASLVFAACSSPGQNTSGSSTSGSSSSDSSSSGSSSSSGAVAPSGGSSSGSASAPGSTGSSGTSGTSGGATPAAGDACGTPHGKYADPAKVGGAVKVAWNQSFYSVNNLTGHGNAVANGNPLYLMNAQVNYYDDKLQLVNNDNFVSCTLVSKDPLTIKYTVNKAAKWSDGVPVTAADLMLSWAAQSGKYNTGDLKTDDNGNPIAQPNVVAFDASSTGLALVKDIPQITDDGQSITLKYSSFFADYAIALGVGVPAHVIGMHVLGAKDGATGATAMNDAFTKTDKASLKKIADFYNTGFDFTELPTDKSLYLSDGAYLLTDFKKDQFMTFKANPDYTWGPKPSVQQITYRFIPDAMASVQALQNGETDLTNPQATVDVLGAVNALKSQGVNVINTIGSTYEHVDMAENNKGPFDPAAYGGDKAKALDVRSAFIKIVPRQSIVTRLIKPLNPNAVARDSFNVVPGAPGYDEIVKNNDSANWKDADIQGAKDLLAKAGVKTPLTVRVLFAKDNVRRQNEFKLMQASAQQAGFNLVDASRTDWGSQLQNTKIYDANFFGWQSTNTGVTSACDNYKTKGQNNFYGYSNATLDAACVKLNLATTPEAQLAQLTIIEKALWDDAFGTVIFQFPEIVAFNSKKIQNVKMIPLSPGPFWNFWEWTAGS